MDKLLLEMLSSNKINFKEITFKQKKYNVCYINDKLFFLHEFDGKIENVKLKNIEIGSLMQDHLEQFLETLKLSLKDEVDSNILDLKAILWDIYLIGIFKRDENSALSTYDKGNIERDMYIARKIIIEDTNYAQIAKKILEQICAERYLKQLISSKSIPQDDDEIIDFIMNGFKNEKGDRIPDSYKVIDEKWSSVSDIKKYLDDYYLLY